MAIDHPFLVNRERESLVGDMTVKRTGQFTTTNKLDISKVFHNEVYIKQRSKLFIFYCTVITADCGSMCSSRLLS